VSTQAILERERRYRRWVAAASILPLLLLVGASALQASGASSSDLVPDSLRAVNEDGAPLLIGSILAAIAFALPAATLFYLFKAAQARSERMLGALVFLVVLGPILFGLQGVLLALSEIDVAEKFVAQEGGLGDIYSLSNNLREDSALRTAAYIAQSIGAMAFVFGMIYVPLWSVRTGLLTRFHGTLGMALGASLILPFLAGLTFPMLLAWFMYFGLMLSGRTPKGRPPAWDAGMAVPPPGRGEKPEPVAAATGGAFVEGNATEIPGVDENPNAARRERAKKRKRKRRR